MRSSEHLSLHSIRFVCAGIDCANKAISEHVAIVGDATHCGRLHYAPRSQKLGEAGRSDVFDTLYFSILFLSLSKVHCVLNSEGEEGILLFDHGKWS